MEVQIPPRNKILRFNRFHKYLVFTCKIEQTLFNNFCLFSPPFYVYFLFRGESVHVSKNIHEYIVNAR